MNQNPNPGQGRDYKKHFKLLDNDSKKKILEKLAKKEAEVRVWMKGNTDRVITFKLLAYNGDKRKMSLELLSDEASVRKEEVEVLLEVEMRQERFLGRGYLVPGLEVGKFIIDLDEAYKTVQRARLRISASKDLKILFIINSHTYEGLNVSSSGVLINVPHEKQRIFNFKNEQKLADCVLEINDKTFNIKYAKIIRSVPNPSAPPPNPGMRKK